MAAVTITRAPRYRTGPTTPPRPRMARAVYVRRRIAAALLGIALVLVMAQAGAALGGSTLAAPERRPAPPAHTVVRPGDSLWSIATRLAPGEDPRPVVDALESARHGAPLVPGESVEWGG
ncbi:MAG TPA: LysM domain-containing protein [Acidimicrobiia bacterium]|nr:LysM domain-containing protein [Acidimicrobiia bacterium]